MSSNATTKKQRLYAFKYKCIGFTCIAVTLTEAETLLRVYLSKYKFNTRDGELITPRFFKHTKNDITEMESEPLSDTWIRSKAEEENQHGKTNLQ